jgi:WD40 repeat protein
MSNEIPNSNFLTRIKLQHTLSCHKEINIIAWSPDGKIIAAGYNDKIIRLWDAQKGKVSQTLKGHSAEVYGLAWSPNGRMLASASADQTIRLWDLKTSKLHRLLKGHSGQVWSLAWSPDGQVLASAGDDEIVRLWDVWTGRPLQKLKDPRLQVNCVAWSNNGQILALGGGDGILWIWDERNQELRRMQKEHPDVIYSTAWSPNGQILASSGDSPTQPGDFTIKIWNWETGEQIKVLKGHTKAIYSVSFSADGRLFASLSGDGSIRVWHSDTWDLVAVIKEDGSAISGLAFHPQKSVLASVCEQNMAIRVWDIEVDFLLGKIQNQNDNSAKELGITDKIELSYESQITSDLHHDIQEKKDFISDVNYPNILNKDDKILIFTSDLSHPQEVLSSLTIEKACTNESINPINENETIQDNHSAKLLENLLQIPPGREHWRQYEDICIKILNYAFIPPLLLPKIQFKSEDGLDRLDAIYPISSGDPIWGRIQIQFKTRYVVTEFKNYVNPPDQKAVESLSQYLYIPGLRSFGILCSRKKASDSALKARRRAWLDANKLIVMLCDQDMQEILSLKANDQNPAQVIDSQIDDFFMHLCP